ncbi:MAG: adenylosuccinate lyase [Nitrososphaerales archaeon]
MPREESFDHHTFISPFTWRYGSEEMRKIFSEIKTRSDWRRIWTYLAEAQAEYGLVTKEEVEDLKSKMTIEHIDLNRSHQIEEEIRHDLMAEIKTYAEQTPIGGGKIHLGATSADIEDNTDAVKLLQATDIILTRLVNCLNSLAHNISKYADLTCIGWTHLQPAEPTTLGYRFATYAQDLTLDIANLENLRQNFIKGKGLKGAVGTSASYKNLLTGKAEPSDLEKKVMNRLELEAFPITSQTYPRKIDHLVMSTLSNIAQSTHKFGLDVRILQSPVFGELSEPLGKSQVGSSTMAFKRNPVTSERMCSLARFVSALPTVSFMNASYSMLERTLDDSANRRIIIPEAFLAIDECLTLHLKISSNITVNTAMIKQNLERFGVFAGTEAVLVEMVKKRGDRQKIHEKIRRHSFKAWNEVSNGRSNPLKELLTSDSEINALIPSDTLKDLLNPSNYTGDASHRAKKFIKETVNPILSRFTERLGQKSKTHF